jgi:hypothetical protein
MKRSKIFDNVKMYFNVKFLVVAHSPSEINVYANYASLGVDFLYLL